MTVCDSIHTHMLNGFRYNLNIFLRAFCTTKTSVSPPLRAINVHKFSVYLSIRMAIRCDRTGLGQLRRLDLSRNDIGGLPDGALRHSPRLQRVMLDSNQLTTLRQCSLSTSAADLPPYLRTLSLVGNPLYCDCRLAWLYGVRTSTTVWWAACRGGINDNQTSVIRHHSYYGLERDACVASSSLSQHCPFNA